MGGDGTPPLNFFFLETILASAFDLLNKLRLILWVVTLLEACDITKHARPFERHLGFYQELENQFKPREMIIFFVLNMCKITQISTLHHLIHNLYFYW